MGILFQAESPPAVSDSPIPPMDLPIEPSRISIPSNPDSTSRAIDYNEEPAEGMVSSSFDRYFVPIKSRNGVGDVKVMKRGFGFVYDVICFSYSYIKSKDKNTSILTSEILLQEATEGIEINKLENAFEYSKYLIPFGDDPVDVLEGQKVVILGCRASEYIKMCREQVCNRTPYNTGNQDTL